MTKKVGVLPLLEKWMIGTIQEGKPENLHVVVTTNPSVQKIERMMLLPDQEGVVHLLTQPLAESGMMMRRYQLNMYHTTQLKSQMTSQIIQPILKKIFKTVGEESGSEATENS
jgi:hypothetical protein